MVCHRHCRSETCCHRCSSRQPRHGDPSAISSLTLAALLLATTVQSFAPWNAATNTRRPKIWASNRDNSEGETADGKDDIFSVLDRTFEYEGRLPSRNAGNGSEYSYRCGFVGIVGAPNMGKSTFLNALLETDLCVTTARPQTTRHAILGVLTTDDCQLCFLDTPGVIGEPAYKLQEGMMEAVRGTLKDSDVLLVVTDLFSTPIPDDVLFEKVRVCGKPTIVVINKIDLVNRLNPDANGNDAEGRTVTVPAAVAKWRALLPNALAILPACASDGPDDPGVAAIRRILMGGSDVPAALRNLGRPIRGSFRPGAKTVTDDEARGVVPQGPPLYDEETLTDRTERFFASEMIRAALFENLGKELPYCCEVRVTEFKEREEGGSIIRMRATVFVERDSQKGIVIGKGGKKIKDVGVAARKKLEEFFQAKIFLDLSVKVDKDWRRDEKKLRAYGYMK